MQSSKEEQGKIRKPSSVINAKKEENNRMGKTRDLFKKIRDTKGTFHAKMGTIKDRNGMDLTEAEDIKKRWQEYTESDSEVTQSFPTLCNPMDCSLPAPPSMGFSRQEYWSGLPLPSPRIHRRTVQKRSS